MRYIFEDDNRDIFSKMFQKAFSEETLKNITYAQGNSKIQSVVEDMLMKTSEDIIVYMDLIPDNKCTVMLYRDLRRISMRNKYRVIVLPMICMEKTIVKLLRSYRVINDEYETNIVENILDWRKSRIITTEQDKEFVRNFEKYCKLVIMKLPYDCAKKGSVHDKSIKYKFYTDDCKCGHSVNTCIDALLGDKVRDLLFLMPCFPRVDTSKTQMLAESIGRVDLWDIHRKLVDRYNEAAKRYYEQHLIDNDMSVKYIK